MDFWRLRVFIKKIDKIKLKIVESTIGFRRNDTVGSISIIRKMVSLTENTPSEFIAHVRDLTDLSRSVFNGRHGNKGEILFVDSCQTRQTAPVLHPQW